MKPRLKPPGNKRFELKCDILLSTSAFKFNLRRFSLVEFDLHAFERDFELIDMVAREVRPAAIPRPTMSTVHLELINRHVNCTPVRPESSPSKSRLPDVARHCHVGQEARVQHACR
jgi:hypothetical protein